MLRGLLLICLISGLSACAGGRADMALAIESRKDLRQSLLGRTISANSGQSFTLRRDGSLVGRWNNAPLLGRFEMRDGFFCLEMQAGPHGPQREDCQVLVLDGDLLAVTQERGRGETMIFRVQ